MRYVSCSANPASTGANVNGALIADTAGRNVSYRVDWGDGVVERVPASGVVAASTPVRASHAWQAKGDYVLSVTATDDGEPPLTSRARQYTQSISCVFARSNTLLVGLVRRHGRIFRFESGSERT